MVTLLIERGVEVGRRNHMGATAADLARRLLSGSMTTGGKLLSGLEQFPTLFTESSGSTSPGNDGNDAVEDGAGGGAASESAVREKAEL